MFVLLIYTASRPRYFDMERNEQKNKMDAKKKLPEIRNKKKEENAMGSFLPDVPSSLLRCVLCISGLPAKTEIMGRKKQVRSEEQGKGTKCVNAAAPRLLAYTCFPQQVERNV